jgi:hypothetical protein
VVASLGFTQSLMKEILQQAGLTEEEFRKLL